MESGGGGGRANAARSIHSKGYAPPKSIFQACNTFEPCVSQG